MRCREVPTTVVEVTSFFTGLCSPCSLVGLQAKETHSWSGHPDVVRSNIRKSCKELVWSSTGGSLGVPMLYAQASYLSPFVSANPSCILCPKHGPHAGVKESFCDTEEAHLISTGTSDLRSPMGETPANPTCASITANCLQVLMVPWRQSPHRDGLVACTCGLRCVACFRGPALWRRELRATGGALSF